MKHLIAILTILLTLPVIAQDADPLPGYADRMEMLSRMHTELPVIARSVCDRYQGATQWPEVGTMCEIDGDEAVCMPYLPLYGPLGSCSTAADCETAGDKDCKMYHGAHCGVEKGSGSVITLGDGTGSCSYKCCNGAVGVRRCYRPSVLDRLERRGRGR